MPYLNTGTPSLCHSHKRDLHVWWLVIQSQTTVTPYKRWFIRLLYLHISLSLTVKASKGHQSQDHGDCRRAWPANQKDPNIFDVIPIWMRSIAETSGIPAFVSWEAVIFWWGKQVFSWKGEALRFHIHRRQQNRPSWRTEVYIKIFFTINSLDKEGEAA